MPTPIACPRCGTSLDVPDNLMDGPVRCANCGTVFNPPTVPGAVATVHPADRPKAKSRSGCLWTALAAAIFGGFCCCGGCFALINYVDNPTFKPYSAPDQSYTVSFPGDATPVKRFGVGGQVVGAECTRLFPQERFFVEYLTLTPAEAREDARKKLGTICDGWLATVPGGREVRRYDREVEGHPAIELFVQTDGLQQNNLYVRVIRVGDRVYSVGISGQIMAEHKHGDEFLDSFKPTPK